MEIGGGLLGEACLGTRHCGWPLYCHYSQEGIGVSGTFSFLLCFYNLFFFSCSRKMRPGMVGGGLGPGPAWPLGGGGHRMAEILFGESTLQGEEEGLARGILNFKLFVLLYSFFFLCVI